MVSLLSTTFLVLECFVIYSNGYPLTKYNLTTSKQHQYISKSLSSEPSEHYAKSIKRTSYNKNITSTHWQTSQHDTNQVSTQIRMSSKEQLSILLSHPSPSVTCLPFKQLGMYHYCLHQPAVAMAAVVGMHKSLMECARHMSNHRWNCGIPPSHFNNFSSSSHYKYYQNPYSYFHVLKNPLVKKNTKESAVMLGLMAAGGTWEVARRCLSGEVPCGCYKERSSQNSQWRYPEECGTSIQYASAVVKDLMEGRMNQKIKNNLVKNSKKRIEKRKKNYKQMRKKFRNEIKREPGAGNAQRRNKRMVVISDDGTWRLQRHNMMIGRKVVEDTAIKSCRCHGISGSCNVETCWKVPASLSRVTLRLKRLYRNAVKVTNSNHVLSHLKIDYTNHINSKLVTTYRIKHNLKKEKTRIKKPEKYINYKKFVKRHSYTKRKKQNTARLKRPGFTNHKTTKHINRIQKLRHRKNLLRTTRSFESLYSSTTPSLPQNRLIYMHLSPDYCHPIPSLHYPGTKGRVCTLPRLNNSLNDNISLKINVKTDERYEFSHSSFPNNIYYKNYQQSKVQGTCQHLCCGRGYKKVVERIQRSCNCVLQWCCSVFCDTCFHTNTYHVCL